MSFSVCFIERKAAGSPSIERVFRCVASELEKRGVETTFVQVPFGNGIFDTLRNLVQFRPPEADIYHITGQINYLGLTLPKDRTVLTIHDLTILDLRSGLRRWAIKILYFSWPIIRLKHLTAISEGTVERVRNEIDADTTKFTRIDNPLLVSTSRRTRVFDSERPRILQLGTAPNKNVDRLIEALRGLSCRLHIVGKLSLKQRSRIEANGIHLIHDEILDDEMVEDAYEQADIVSLCSLDEGFGLPIIEGQAKGAIVVTSDRPPMRDISGGGSELVDPAEIESIRGGFDRVIESEDHRKDLSEKARANLTRFDPVKIGEEYFKLYQAMMTKNG